MKLFNFFLVEYLFTKGQAYFSKNMLDPAIQAYDRALKINPSKDGIYLHKALALSRLGRYEDAIQMIGQAINLNPKNPVYPLFAGIIHLDAGYTDSALKYFDKSIQVEKTYVFPRQYRALALLKDRKIQEAVAVFEKEGVPWSGEFKSRLFIIINEIKNEIQNEEFQMIERLIKEKLLAGKRELSIINYSPEKADLKSTERKQKKVLAEEYKRAQQLKHLGALEKAVGVCQTILAKDPDSYKVIKLLAETYFDMEKYADSELCYKKVKEKLNDDVEVLYQLGISQYRQHKFSEAIKNLSRAFGLAESHIKGEIAYWLGKAYWKQNQVGQAAYYLSVPFETVEGSFFENSCLEMLERGGHKG